MRKDHKLGLSTRTFIILISLSAVFLLVTVLVQTVFFSSFYAKTKKQEISKALSSVITEISSDEENLQGYCDGIARYYNVCLLVTDESMNVIASSEGSPGCPLMHMDSNALRMLYEIARDNGGTYSKEESQSESQFPPNKKGEDKDQSDYKNRQDDQRSSLLKVQIVSTDFGVTRIVYVNSEITPVRNIRESLRIQLTVLSAVMLLLSVILSLIYSRQLSKPIIEMNNEADKLANGNFDVHFEQSSGSRELDELGEKLNHAASELAKVDSLRTELIANVSHDLRTPLTLITGYSEMMRDLPGENNAENLNLIIDESKRLSQIVNDVLDISRFQSGTMELNMERFCINDEISSLLTRLSAFTSAEGYKLSFNYDESIFVTADRSAISRVMYNLISNAINYTDSENRSVEIVQAVEGESDVRIDVIDHGKGISQEELPYIFDRYYRSKDTHVRSVIGSGLGLSIVKSILTAHDARFGVLSSPGKGSDFWFTLKIT